MSSRQLSCDLRVVGVDLGCAAIRVLVWGVAGVGSWLGRHRQDVAADRAQRILDAERLVEHEAERDAWEPDELWRPDGPSALVWPEVRDAAVETGGLDICPTHTTTFPAGGCCRVCFPVGVSSAGAGGGPEVVSGQPPASGQPTAPDELEDSDLLYTAAGALVVYADKHGDIPFLITELRDRAAQFAAFERRHK